jgi:hypothetical protein
VTCATCSLHSARALIVRDYLERQRDLAAFQLMATSGEWSGRAACSGNLSLPWLPRTVVPKDAVLYLIRKGATLATSSTTTRSGQLLANWGARLALWPGG